MSLIPKNKLSSLIQNQLPEHFSDYTKFVRFIELYYEFLEQNEYAIDVIQNAKSYSDIDTTIDSFVQYFLKEYSADAPEGILLDKKILIKKIKSLYESKGTVDSYKLLFSMLYNEKIEVRYPYQNVLIPSSGVWIQRASLRFEIITGDMDEVSTKLFYTTVNDIVYTFGIEEYKLLRNGLYEVFIDLNKVMIPFEIDGIVYAYDTNGNVIFSASLKPTITDYTIVIKGTGFKKGQVIFISEGNATSTLIKIDEVDSNGGIIRLTFIAYGYDYNDLFTIDLKNNLSFAVKSSFFDSDFSFYEEIQISSHTGEFTNPDRYFESNYVEDPTLGINLYTADAYETNTYSVSFTPNNGATNDSDINIATIQFFVNALSKYPGGYVSYKGFLSESEVRIQDDKLYQPFAYQIQSDLDINTFYSVVKNMIHQSGSNMFNNRRISSSHDIESSIQLEVF